MRKAYRESDVSRVDKLMAEQTRWKRKRTIAENKLEDIRYRIDNLLEELAQPKKEGS